MPQYNGADARIIVRPERTFKTLPVVSISDCETAWAELVDADVTLTADATVYKAGTKSIKMIAAAGLAAGDIMATVAFAAKDLTYCTKVGMWIRSSVALASGDLQLLLDNTASCASPVESLDIPAVANVDTWTYVKMTLAAPASCSAIISAGIKMVVDKAAFTVYVDDIRALEGDALIIPFNSATFGLQEALEESNAIRSGRQPQKPTGGQITGSGTLQVELNPYHALLLKHILGGCTTSDLGGGVAQHILTIGDLGQGLALEVQHTKAGNLLYTVYHIKGNSLAISQNATGKVMADMGWEIAKEEDDTNQTTLDGSPTDYGHKPFSAKFGAFYEGGVAQSGLATTMKIDYNNNIEGEPTIGSEGERDSLTEGKAKIGFNFDILWKDTTIDTKAKALTESSLKLVNINGAGDGTLGDEYVEVEMKEVLYSRPQRKIDGPKGLKANYNGIAYYDDDAGAQAITITFKTTQAALT